MLNVTTMAETVVSPIKCNEIMIILQFLVFRQMKKTLHILFFSFSSAGFRIRSNLLLDRTTWKKVVLNFKGPIVKRLKFRSAKFHIFKLSLKVKNKTIT